MPLPSRRNPEQLPTLARARPIGLRAVGPSQIAPPALREGRAHSPQGSTTSLRDGRRRTTGARGSTRAALAAGGALGSAGAALGTTGRGALDSRGTASLAAGKGGTLTDTVAAAWDRSSTATCTAVTSSITTTEATATASGQVRVFIGSSSGTGFGFGFAVSVGFNSTVSEGAMAPRVRTSSAGAAGAARKGSTGLRGAVDPGSVKRSRTPLTVLADKGAVAVVAHDAAAGSGIGFLESVLCGADSCPEGKRRGLTSPSSRASLSPPWA